MSKQQDCNYIKTICIWLHVNNILECGALCSVNTTIIFDHLYSNNNFHRLPPWFPKPCLRLFRHPVR